MTPRPTPIILDVDTGVDDACALLLAALHPGVELRAITRVGGNASVDDVVRNTFMALDVDADRNADLWLQTMKESPL